MPEPFVQTVHVENTIKNILEHYPLVDGPLRELLQNSDDAGATIQVKFPKTYGRLFLRVTFTDLRPRSTNTSYL